jgi:hypothetical protein
VWGTTDKNPVIAETQIWRLLRHFGIAGERMRAWAHAYMGTYIRLRPPAAFYAGGMAFALMSGIEAPDVP